MRLRHLRDIYRGQELYIVGSGPSINIFPKDFLRDKICLSLNDTYKAHPAIQPIALMHHEAYSRTGASEFADFHPLLENIKYPIVKISGKNRVPSEQVDWENPYFYFYDWSLDINKIWTMTKDTDELYYTPEGCSLHAALQIAWIMGFETIYTIGCDSRTMGGRHYAAYDKNGFRALETAPNKSRNYDSYVYGTLIIQKFLKEKGIELLNLSSIVGFHLIDLQYDVLSGTLPIDSILEQTKETEASQT
jgi:hypothetical protein